MASVLIEWILNWIFNLCLKDRNLKQCQYGPHSQKMYAKFIRVCCCLTPHLFLNQCQWFSCPNQILHRNKNDCPIDPGDSSAFWIPEYCIGCQDRPHGESMGGERHMRPCRGDWNGEEAWDGKALPSISLLLWEWMWFLYNGKGFILFKVWPPKEDPHLLASATGRAELNPYKKLTSEKKD